MHTDAARIERIALCVDDVSNHAVQIHQLAACHVALTRKHEQIPYDALGAAGFATDRFQRLAVIIRPFAAQQQLREAADCRQRIVELMGNTRQHVTK